MIYLYAYMALLALCGLVWDRWRRPLLLVGLPLLALDGLANALLLQSIRRTMSGEAWAHREHRYWRWCHVWIDWLFSIPIIGQVDHCRRQWEREERHGGWWGAWLHDWRSA